MKQDITKWMAVLKKREDRVFQTRRNLDIATKTLKDAIAKRDFLARQINHAIKNGKMEFDDMMYLSKERPQYLNKRTTYAHI